MLEQLIAWYAPHTCLGCGTEGALLCAACVHAIEPVADRCYRCHQLAARGRTCVACQRHSALYSVRAATTYAGSAKQLIGRLKFGGAQAAADGMARAMAALLPDEDVLLVYLPTASSRIRRRGYDQAKLITRHLLRYTGKRSLACLARHGQQRQVGATREQRLKQLRESFTVIRPVTGAHIVLIDDVTTTGASLEAAAAALKVAGAVRIEAVVFARA